MAINIYSGTAPKKNNSSKVVNSASDSTRQKRLDAQLQGSSAVSTSGNTAVKSKGTLSKVGNFIGKAAGIASKFLPGLAGTVSKGLANLFNDPEWWESVPGEGISTNQTLRTIDLGSATMTPAVGIDSSVLCGNVQMCRPPFAEIVSVADLKKELVATITPNMMTQYVMPAVRKLINAVPLEAATSYAYVMERNITVYALWRQLLKIRFLVQHGKPYIPNTNDKAFPLLQVVNSAYLDSTINRLEEYMRSNVRLPHTMCEYLSWRFGRIYLSNDSQKSSLIMYNVIPLTTTIADVDAFIQRLMGEISAAPDYQKAQADLYTVYYNHDLNVVIADSTQFSYDKKEFMLRINMDIDTIVAFGLQHKPEGNSLTNKWLVGSEISHHNLENNPVVIDSALDNQTVFMASTVSTHTESEPLFPVRDLRVYCIRTVKANGDVIPAFPSYAGADVQHYPGGETTPFALTMNSSTQWYGIRIMACLFQMPTYNTLPDSDIGTPDKNFMVAAQYFFGIYCGINAVLKALDFYNVDMFVVTKEYKNGDGQYIGDAADTTALAIDLGLVEDSVLSNEQVYAFANLVHETRRTSTTAAAAEKQVTAETANLIDKLDVVSAS